MLLLLVLLLAEPCALANTALSELARSHQWERVVEVASRRGEQLPLSPSEAMIAAHAAGRTGNADAEQRFLEIAVGGGPGHLATLADVLLADLVAEDDPARAVDLAVPRFDRGAPAAVREHAAEVVARIVADGAARDRRARIEAAVPRLPRGARRPLELALALTDDEHGPERLRRLLRASTRDLVALAAAESLLEVHELPPDLKWSVVQALFDHALYDRAVPLLEDLAGTPVRGIPADEVAFLRGRCAFRLERWTEAVEWYEKALAVARTTERKAELEVHVGRAWELAGDLDTAVAAGQRAVRADSSDPRRLFLARLRLRRGEVELASRGLGRLRSRGARTQGEMMLALDAWRRGDASEALRRLSGIRRFSWVAPAAVFQAELLRAAGKDAEALDALDRKWSVLGAFWSEQARDSMLALTPETTEAWRRQRRQAVAVVDGRSRWRELARWATLETDSESLSELRRLVASEMAAHRRSAEVTFPDSLAGELWQLGLEHEAALWDAGGFPRDDATQSAWTAGQFRELGLPWMAVRDGDGAWRQLGSEMPVRALPVELQRSTYPLPIPDLVQEAAAAGGIHWSLLAAVAREESRWDPDALSVVGARGLMQLMPGTARAVAARLGREPVAMDRLFESRTNLLLGAAELGRLERAFEGLRAPAIAAYNAGEAQARLWLEQCGGGCTDSRYVAGISFTATRNYTAAVLAAASAYRELYSEEGRAVPARGDNLSD